jgi:hypothetical protein
MTQPSPKSQKPLTERQCFWREHLLAAEQAGVRLSDYAEREGLSVQAMYAARAVLRERGALAPVDSASVTFTAVQVADPPPTLASLVVHLPNGVRVELTTPLTTAGVGELLRWASHLP